MREVRGGVGAVEVRIYTLWESSEPDIPWLVAAIDEYTFEDGSPDAYKKAKEGEGLRGEPARNRRELVIDIPESAVRALFGQPEVKGTVVDE